MAAQTTNEDLVQLVHIAIHLADAHGEWAVAAHLNQAMIALTGKGVMPLAMLGSEYLDQSFVPS